MSESKHPYGTPACICPGFPAAPPSREACPVHGAQLKALDYEAENAAATRLSNADDRSDYARRRRNFFVGLFWTGAAVVLLVLWLAGLIHAQTQITPRQIRGLASVVVMECAGVTAAGPPISDCTGLYYVDLVRADGTELKIVGAPPAPGVTIDPAHWSVIP